jgi:hypothetical protein
MQLLVLDCETFKIGGMGYDRNSIVHENKTMDGVIELNDQFAPDPKYENNSFKQS